MDQICSNHDQMFNPKTNIKDALVIVFLVHQMAVLSFFYSASAFESYTCVSILYAPTYIGSKSASQKESYNVYCYEN